MKELFQTRNICKSCIGLDGINCPGENKVIIEVDYWFQSDNEQLISSDCPTGYCCQSTSGCIYTGNNEQVPLCAVGRDPNVPMCGACKHGLTEYIGSVQKQ